jgi:hypothetical protein
MFNPYNYNYETTALKLNTSVKRKMCSIQQFLLDIHFLFIIYYLKFPTPIKIEKNLINQSTAFGDIINYIVSFVSAYSKKCIYDRK